MAETAAALAPPRAPLVLLARPDRAAVVPAEVDAAPVLASVPARRCVDGDQKGEQYANATHGHHFLRCTRWPNWIEFGN